MRPFFCLLGFISFVGTAQAQQLFTCHFTQECFEGEACVDTDVTLTLRNEPDSDSAMTLITDAETLTGAGIQRDGPAHAIFVGKTALHVFSTQSGQGARYTIHMQGLMAITYQGKCEAAE